MNFYEKSRNQRLHNKATLISYTAGYLCFMNTPGSSDSSTDNWYKRYLSSNQVDRKAMKLLTNEDLVVNNIAISHRSAAVRYTISEVLSHYFTQAMRKDKVIYKNGKTSYACDQTAIAG